jgi:hypothetical protein
VASDGTPVGDGFVSALRARTVPGVAFVDLPAAEVPLIVAASPHVGAPAVPGAIVVRPRLARGPVTDRELHLPLDGATPRLAELSIRPSTPIEAEARGRVARTLERLGFVVALTAAADMFVTTRLLRAYLHPLLRAVAAGGDVGAVNQALRRMGFVRRPASLLAGIDGEALVDILRGPDGAPDDETHRGLRELGRDALSASGDDAVVDAVCLSLLAAVLDIRAEDAVSHPSIVDLVARELLDFPRHLRSLSTWLKTARVAEALRRERRVRGLVADTVLAAADAFVVTGREFYR